MLQACETRRIAAIACGQIALAQSGHGGDHAVVARKPGIGRNLITVACARARTKGDRQTAETGTPCGIKHAFRQKCPAVTIKQPDPARRGIQNTNILRALRGGGITDSAARALSNRAGVDLDAEAARMMQLQQAYQANAQSVKTARELFETLLAAL